MRRARDCIVAMTAFLTHTRRIKVAAGVPDGPILD